jgi:hypothetical protein
MSELSLDLLRFEEGLMKCRPIFDIPLQTYAERQRVEMLAPDRTVGVIAAYEYLQHNRTRINTSIAIPALGIMIIALMFAVVAWAVR